MCVTWHYSEQGSRDPLHHKPSLGLAHGDPLGRFNNRSAAFRTMNNEASRPSEEAWLHIAECSAAGFSRGTPLAKLNSRSPFVTLNEVGRPLQPAEAWLRVAEISNELLRGGGGAAAAPGGAYTVSPLPFAPQRNLTRHAYLPRERVQDPGLRRGGRPAAAVGDVHA